MTEKTFITFIVRIPADMYAFKAEKAELDWMDSYMEHKEKLRWNEYEKQWEKEAREEEFKEFMKDLAREKYSFEKTFIRCEGDMYEQFVQAVHISDAYDNSPVILYDTAYGFSVYGDLDTITFTDGWTIWIERQKSNLYKVHDSKDWTCDGFRYKYPHNKDCKYMTFNQVFDYAEQLDCEYLDWLEEDEEEEEEEEN